MAAWGPLKHMCTTTIRLPLKCVTRLPRWEVQLMVVRGLRTEYGFIIISRWLLRLETTPLVPPWAAVITPVTLAAVGQLPTKTVGETRGLTLRTCTLLAPN